LLRNKHFLISSKIKRLDESMSAFAKPAPLSFKYRFIRITAIAVVIFTLQVTVKTPRADASAVSDAYGAISTGIAFDLGYRACSYLCASAAVGTVVAVNTYAPVVANKAVDYAKPGLFEMFTNWGSTFFRP
jgi:hypothetical protein